MTTPENIKKLSDILMLSRSFKIHEIPHETRISYESVRSIMHQYLGMFQMLTLPQKEYYIKCAESLKKTIQ